MASDHEIYEELRRPLMAFATYLVGKDDAWDLISEVIVSALERRTLESLENPKAYLMRAVLNRARTLYRSRSREASALERLQSLTCVDPQDPLAAMDPQVLSLIDELPPQQRAAVYLVYWEDESIQDAADLLGVRPGTLRRYLHLARRKLRPALKDRPPYA